MAKTNYTFEKRQKEIAKKKKKEAKRLQKKGVSGSDSEVVQSASGDDDKTSTSGDT